ncbi:MBL fold metallo-hydrolase [Sphingomonas immobilis]|uniref:MBL fold metallo-hydrolase n=1 Tax=Sphingomonas immobilis TaxID=3063997 RepID=A0ABT8ZYQ7_9SPHN|nr:MBL fold metallo-hydrolase [Sphingomonas sp. CA1-15]MDO7842709.1 MBL fold metallo-hydrolase [Sphingomonas sp. CA1-15]
MKVRVLGSGTSSGVPRIGNDWGACDPADPRNRRTRVSILVETATTRILVDTGPDMREQLLAADVSTLDAVIWTHDHADHTHGIDDLRQVFHAMGRPVRCFARMWTARSLRGRFGYVFEGTSGYPATATIEDLADTLTIGDIALRIADQPHGKITSAGLRFEADEVALGYATDLNDMTDDVAAIYKNLDLWIVDALRERVHPSHADLAMTLGWIDALKPRRALLTHMDQSMDYETLRAELPPGIEPAYDGLEVIL